MPPTSLDPRIEKLYRSDRYWALAALLALWITVVFVFAKVAAADIPGGVMLALALGGSLVLLFNSASIAALLGHYKEDKEHLYGLDIHYLDEMKKSD